MLNKFFKHNYKHNDRDWRQERILGTRIKSQKKLFLNTTMRGNRSFLSEIHYLTPKLARELE